MRGRGKKLRKREQAVRETMRLRQINLGAYDQAVFTALRPSLYFDTQPTSTAGGWAKYEYDSSGNWRRLS